MAEHPRVLFRGDDFSVLVKPAGMSSEVTLNDPRAVDPSLLACAKRELALPNARLPHRLDRIARGLIVVAHDAAAAKRLGADLAAGRWEKRYLARVRLDAKSADRLIGEHTVHLKRSGKRTEIVHSGGQRAVTEIVAVAPAPEHPGQSHALIRLHTGRFHQIRATLAHLGAPVTDDPIYGDWAKVERMPYLEHIALRMPIGGDGRPSTMRTFHDAHDPFRDAVTSSISAHMRSLVEG